MQLTHVTVWQAMRVMSTGVVAVHVLIRTEGSDGHEFWRFCNLYHSPIHMYTPKAAMGMSTGVAAQAYTQTASRYLRFARALSSPALASAMRELNKLSQALSFTARTIDRSSVMSDTRSSLCFIMRVDRSAAHTSHRGHNHWNNCFIKRVDRSAAHTSHRGHNHWNNCFIMRVDRSAAHTSHRGHNQWNNCFIMRVDRSAANTSHRSNNALSSNISKQLT